MHYYKKNIGDYHKKAGRLTMLEHGAYTLLLDACYDRERFPTLEEAIEWTWARTPQEEDAVRFVLSRFFELRGDIYVQPRIEEEVAKYHANSAINSRIAKEREANRTKRSRSVNGASPVEHEPPPNQEPITNNHKPQTSDNSMSEPAAPAPTVKASKPKFTEEDVELAKWIHGKLLVVLPSAKQPNWSTWANHVRLMREVDGRTHREIGELFLWVTKHPFWCRNVMSPDKLRQQWDRLVMQRSAPMQAPSESPSARRDRENQQFMDALTGRNRSTQDEPFTIEATAERVDRSPVHEDGRLLGSPLHGHVEEHRPGSHEGGLG